MRGCQGGDAEPRSPEVVKVAHPRHISLVCSISPLLATDGSLYVRRDGLKVVHWVAIDLALVQMQKVSLLAACL